MKSWVRRRAATQMAVVKTVKVQTGRRSKRSKPLIIAYLTCDINWVMPGHVVYNLAILGYFHSPSQFLCFSFISLSFHVVFFAFCSYLLYPFSGCCRSHIIYIYIWLISLHYNLGASCDGGWLKIPSKFYDVLSWNLFVRYLAIKVSINWWHFFTTQKVQS